MEASAQQRIRHALALCAAATMMLLALWPHHSGNLLGLCGRALSRVLSAAFGHAAWMVPLLVLELARVSLIGRPRWRRALAMLVALTLACTALHLFQLAGGRLGAVVGGGLWSLLGVGAHLPWIVALVFVLTRWTSWSLLKALARAAWKTRRRLAAAWRVATVRENAHHELLPQAPIAPRPNTGQAPPAELHPALPAANAAHEAPSTPAPAPESRARAHAAPALPSDRQCSDAAEDASSHPEPDAEPRALPADATACSAKPYRLPSPLLLAAPAKVRHNLDEDGLKLTAMRLEDRLAGFGILGRVDGLNPGPVVTMYEFAPAPGTKLSKIRELAPELSMALEQGVRVIAPLPGTGRVGIEVPHSRDDREIVSLRILVEDSRWDEFDAMLPVALGRDPSGAPVFTDLAAAPHLLVAGATGTGKSTGLHALLISLLLRRTPDELRLILIDPKVVEFAAFERIPHLLTPVVTEVRDAARALSWAVGEMERRYQLLAEAGVRNISAYNSREGVTLLPSIVVVVDELADLMMAAEKETILEAAIARLAQKARAAGIHLILATQRPSVDVITGLIKANLPTRIAYKVAQLVDSKVILDRRGAEQLLGRGDMLCQLPNSVELQRVHGAYVSEEEIKAICDALRAQHAPEYDHSILASTETGNEDAPHAGGDALYDRAYEFVVAAGSCSVSALQRGLGIGYNKAAGLVERLELAGVVGPASRRAGGKRDVFLPMKT